MSKTNDTTTTRSEHHADSDEQTVRQSRRVVRTALERHCRGRDNAMSGTDLASLTPLAPTTVRDVIAELRDDPTGPPVGNCADGYFVIDTAAELEAWLEQKRGEIATKRERMQANTRSFNREQGVCDDAR